MFYCPLMPFKSMANFQPRLIASCRPVFIPCPPMGGWVWHASPTSAIRPRYYFSMMKEFILKIEDQISASICNNPGIVKHSNYSNTSASVGYLSSILPYLSLFVSYFLASSSCKTMTAYISSFENGKKIKFKYLL